MREGGLLDVCCLWRCIVCIQRLVKHGGRGCFQHSHTQHFCNSYVFNSSCMLRCVVCKCCWMGDGAARPMQGRNERERAGETELKADFLHCGNAAGVRRAAGVFALIMASWACMRAFAWQCAWAPEGLTASSTLKGMHSLAQISWQSVVCTVHHRTGVTHMTWPA